MIRGLLAEADALGAGMITWRHDAEHWYCFASSAPIPHVARAGNGAAALAKLVSFMRGHT